REDAGVLELAGAGRFRLSRQRQDRRLARRRDERADLQTRHSSPVVGGRRRLGQSPLRLTVIATTGEQFSDFAPYVASVNDAGTVAFQAELRGGGTGVFTGSGGAVAETAGPALLAGVTSHPDLNGAGDTSFYGELPGGDQGV